MTTRIPQRLQMTRQASWNSEHPDAIIVCGPSKWGNPFYLSIPSNRNTLDVRCDDGFGTLVFSSPDKFECLQVAVSKYEHWIGRTYDGGTGTLFEQAQRDLSGVDLACRCPLWDEEHQCPQCGGLRSWPPFTRQLCSRCGGSGLTRYPCHGDLLLHIANPDMNFQWDDQHRPKS